MRTRLWSRRWASRCCPTSCSTVEPRASWRASLPAPSASLSSRMRLTGTARPAATCPAWRRSLCCQSSQRCCPPRGGWTWVLWAWTAGSCGRRQRLGVCGQTRSPLFEPCPKPCQPLHRPTRSARCAGSTLRMLRCAAASAHPLATPPLFPLKQRMPVNRTPPRPRHHTLAPHAAPLCSGAPRYCPRYACPSTARTTMQLWLRVRDTRHPISAPSHVCLYARLPVLQHNPLAKPHPPHPSSQTTHSSSLVPSYTLLFPFLLNSTLLSPLHPSSFLVTLSLLVTLPLVSTSRHI